MVDVSVTVVTVVSVTVVVVLSVVVVVDDVVGVPLYGVVVSAHPPSFPHVWHPGCLPSELQQ